MPASLMILQKLEETYDSKGGFIRGKIQYRQNGPAGKDHRCLKERGYKVNVVKHDAHRFDIDHPGKDSYRLTAAGADTMLVSSPENLAMVKRPHLVRGIVSQKDDRYFVSTTGKQSSGRLSSMVLGNGLICLAPESTHAAGEPVKVFLLDRSFELADGTP